MTKVSAVKGDPNALLFSDKNIFNKMLMSKGILKEGQRDLIERLSKVEDQKQ
jgi:hypothetical protein